jgi:hypothetical protein
VLTSLKVCLHYGNYHSKLAHFQRTEKYFFAFKKALAKSKFCHSVNTPLHYGNNRSRPVHLKEQNIFFAFLNSPSLEQLLPLCKYHFKAGFHYGNNHSKLVHFKELKIFLHFLNSSCLERLSP